MDQLQEVGRQKEEAENKLKAAENLLSEKLALEKAKRKAAVKKTRGGTRGVLPWYLRWTMAV